MINFIQKSVFLILLSGSVFCFSSCSSKDGTETQNADTTNTGTADTSRSDTSAQTPAAAAGSELSDKEAEKMIRDFIQRKHLKNSEENLNDLTISSGDYSGDGIRDYFACAFIGPEGTDNSLVSYYFLPSESKKVEEISISPSISSGIINLNQIEVKSIQKDLIKGKAVFSAGEIDFSASDDGGGLISEDVDVEFRISGNDMEFTPESLKKMKKANNRVKEQEARQNEKRYGGENGGEETENPETGSGGE